MDIRLVLENPEKTIHHRNRNADRSLKLDESVFRVHRELLHTSPVLERLVMQDPRTMMNLDHLKADQKHFTPCGLNMIIDWMYGTQIEFSTEYLTDALAAAFALEVYEMVEAIEQAVLKYQKDPEAMVILLYHIDNFTPETKQQLLFAAAEQLAPISLSRPFLGLSSSIFKRIMKLAIGNLDETGNIFEVARAILTWAAENQNIDLAKAMLNRITIENLSYVEANTLHRMAIESGLETMAASIFSRYHVLSTSPVARRLFRDEAKVSASSRFVSEQNAIRELPARKIEERLPAGKNVATEKEEMMTQFKELGPPRTVWVPTREERRAIQHVMSRLETVRFGSIPLDSTTNEMRIEIFQQLLSVQEQERLTNGYPGEAHAIGQDVRDPSSRHLSMAKRLEAAD